MADIGQILNTLNQQKGTPAGIPAQNGSGPNGIGAGPGGGRTDGSGLTQNLENIANDDNSKKDPLSNASDIDALAVALIMQNDVIAGLNQRILAIEELLNQALGATNAPTQGTAPNISAK